MIGGNVDHLDVVLFECGDQVVAVLDGSRCDHLLQGFIESSITVVCGKFPTFSDNRRLFRGVFRIAVSVRDVRPVLEHISEVKIGAVVVGVVRFARCEFDLRDDAVQLQPAFVGVLHPKRVVLIGSQSSEKGLLECSHELELFRLWDIRLFKRQDGESRLVFIVDPRDQFAGDLLIPFENNRCTIRNSIRR